MMHFPVRFKQTGTKNRTTKCFNTHKGRALLHPAFVMLGLPTLHDFRRIYYFRVPRWSTTLKAYYLYVKKCKKTKKVLVF